MLIPLHNTDMLPLIANITYFSSQSFADELDYHSEDESRDVEKQRSFGKTGLQTSHTRCVKCQVIVPCIHHGGGGGGGGGSNHQMRQECEHAPMHVHQYGGSIQCTSLGGSEFGSLPEVN